MILQYFLSFLKKYNPIMVQGITNQIHQDLPLNESDDHDDISKTPFPFIGVVTNKTVFKFLTLFNTY